MRWLPTIILILIFVVLQATLAPALAIRGVRPNWLLVLAVFWGLYAPRKDGILAAAIMGAVADMMTIERFGFQMISYCVAAVFVAALRELVFRHRASTQFAMTLVTGLLLHTAWLIYASLRFGALGSFLPEWFSSVFFVALYSAAWAPLIHRALLTIADLLGIHRPRMRFTI